MKSSAARRAFVVVACCVASTVSASHIQPASADPWAPVRFLVGTWEGTSSGRPGDGTVRREYRLVLRDRFIEVWNSSTYPPQERNPKGERHEDVGYISYDRNRQTFVLRQFHVEGFVNTYVAAPDVSKAIVFTSEAVENIPAGWRARETYAALGPDRFEEVFELAEPSKAFEVYTRARFKRAQ